MPNASKSSAIGLGIEQAEENCTLEYLQLQEEVKKDYFLVQNKLINYIFTCVDCNAIVALDMPTVRTTSDISVQPATDSAVVKSNSIISSALQLIKMT